MCAFHQGYCKQPAYQRRTPKMGSYTRPDPKLLDKPRDRSLRKERDAWLRQERRLREMLVERSRDPFWVQWTIDRERDHYQESWDWVYEG